MGKASTRKAPGSKARSIAAIAFSDAEKNLSLSAYAIDRTKDPVRLANERRIVSPSDAGIGEDRRTNVYA